jgi:hypothetical protein
MGTETNELGVHSEARKPHKVPVCSPGLHISVLPQPIATSAAIGSLADIATITDGYRWQARKQSSRDSLLLLVI